MDTSQEDLQRRRELLKLRRKRQEEEVFNTKKIKFKMLKKIEIK
jgi:hypothetical protein